MTHKCPAPACEVQVSRYQYACRRHWYALPAPMRAEILRAYRAEPLGVEHLEAMMTADQYLEDQFGTAVRA